jgi:hypothetical protein
MGAKVAASSAAGTAALVYVVLSGRLSSDSTEKAPRRRREPKEVEGGSEERWPERAPASWREAAAVAARTVGFAYGETLGKWPIGDIAFGISHYMRLQVIIHTTRPNVSICWNSCSHVSASSS